jgi:hypothetical protein
VRYGADDRHLMIDTLRRVPGVHAAVSLWLMLTVAVIAGEPFRQIKGKEIVRRFQQQEFSDKVHWAYVFGRDGHLSSVSMGKRGGIWRVEGDRLCLLPDAFPERCSEVWMSGNRVQLREPGIEIYEEGILQRPTARQ